MSQQQILDLVARWSRAELDGDLDAYDELLAPDFIGIGPVGFVLGKEDWTGRHREGLTNHHFAVVQPQVKTYGDDVAVVTAVQEQRTTARGHDSSGSFRLILVATQEHDRWAITHLQLSGPLRTPDAPPPFARVPAEATISRQDLHAALDAGTVTVIDALPEPAYARRHLPSALNLTAEDANSAASRLVPDPSTPIVVYSTDEACTRGVDLAAALIRLGYQDVRRYAGGIEDWVGAGLPIESGTAAGPR
jgi:uncharacterized protein (TIGR02246 family)